MGQYSIIILLLAISIVLSAVAKNIKLPYPVLLMLGGIAVGFVPNFERLNINPEVVFLIFLPPLLCDAAYNISFKEFKENIRTISSLAISLVFITVVGIAAVAHYLIPGFSWAMGLTLGAILAPTDAVSAISIIQGSSLSARTRTIIEGESLVNDASALTAYHFAVAAVAGSTFVWWKASLEFIWIIAGGCLVGACMWYLFAFIIRKIKMSSIVTMSFNLLIPFVAYLISEEIGISGVLAVVTFGLFLSVNKEKVFSAETRNQSQTLWGTITFILNGLIFILIGMEFPHVLKQIPHDFIWELTLYAVLISLVALMIRIGLLFINRIRLNRSINRFIYKKVDDAQKQKEMAKLASLQWKDALIIGWSGMRGIVSLATALGLPFTMVDGNVFPLRDTIIFLTVAVVLIMLLVQGLGFGYLIHWLKLDVNVESTVLTSRTRNTPPANVAEPEKL